MRIGEIKNKAREGLRGKWMKAIGILLAYWVVFILLEILTYFLSIFTIIGGIVLNVAALIPLSFGLLVSFIKLLRNEEIKSFEFCDIGLENFKRSWKIKLRIYLKTIISIICQLIGSFAIIIFITGKIIAGLQTLGNTVLIHPKEVFEMPINIFIFGCIMLIAGIILCIIQRLPYVLSYMIVYDNPNLSSKEVIDKSKNLMIGNKIKYVALQLSFIGWMILGIITYGIGFIWIIPYMKASNICFYEDIIKSNGDLQETNDE